MAGLTYIGKGAFVPPYPARDLTEEEVRQFGEDVLLATGLYQKTEAGKQKFESKKQVVEEKPTVKKESE